MYIVFDDETELSIKYSTFKKLFCCNPSFHFIGCSHYLHKKCFEQLDKTTSNSFTCPACRRKCNFYMDIVNYDEINEKMKIESSRYERKNNKKICNIDELLLNSLELNKKEIGNESASLNYLYNVQFNESNEIRNVMDVMESQSDTKMFLKVYDSSLYKMLMSKTLQIIGSIETLEIAMREDTAIQHSALLFKDGSKIGIKHEHRKLLQLLLNKTFEYNLDCMIYNNDPFNSFYFGSVDKSITHNILSYFFVFLNHIVTSDGILTACEIAAKLAYIYVLFDSLLVLNSIAPADIGI